MAIFRAIVPEPESTGVLMSRAAIFICLPFAATLAFRALGNSMAVNAMDWLGQRIEHVRGILAKQERKS